jgi:hypothetical protein
MQYHSGEGGGRQGRASHLAGWQVNSIHNTLCPTRQPPTALTPSTQKNNPPNQPPPPSGPPGKFELAIDGGISAYRDPRPQLVVLSSAGVERNALLGDNAGAFTACDWDGMATVCLPFVSSCSPDDRSTRFFTCHHPFHHPLLDLTLITPTTHPHRTAHPDRRGARARGRHRPGEPRVGPQLEVRGRVRCARVGLPLRGRPLHR